MAVDTTPAPAPFQPGEKLVCEVVVSSVTPDGEFFFDGDGIMNRASRFRRATPEPEGVEALSEADQIALNVAAQTGEKIRAIFATPPAPEPDRDAELTRQMQIAREVLESEAPVLRALAEGDATPLAPDRAADDVVPRKELDAAFALIHKTAIDVAAARDTITAQSDTIAALRAEIAGLRAGTDEKAERAVRAYNGGLVRIGIGLYYKPKAPHARRPRSRGEGGGGVSACSTFGWPNVAAIGLCALFGIVAIISIVIADIRE